MRNLSAVKRVCSFLLLGAVLSLTLASTASAGPPIGKVYGCYTNGGGGLQLVQALELKSRTAYLVAPSFKGHRLVGKAAQGQYKLHGSMLTFLTGAYRHMYGVYVPQHTVLGNVIGAAIGLQTSHHRPTYVSCYLS